VLPAAAHAAATRSPATQRDRRSVSPSFQHLIDVPSTTTTVRSIDHQHSTSSTPQHTSTRRLPPLDEIVNLQPTTTCYSNGSDRPHRRRIHFWS